MVILTVFLNNNYHLTINTVRIKIGKSWKVLIEALVDIATTRMKGRDAKVVEAEIKFPTTEITLTLQILRQRVTTNWFNLVF